MSDPRPTDTQDAPTFAMAKQLGLIPPAPTPTTAEAHNDTLAALVDELATTNRHLGAIVNELRVRNRVVGL